MIEEKISFKRLAQKKLGQYAIFEFKHAMVGAAVKFTVEIDTAMIEATELDEIIGEAAKRALKYINTAHNELKGYEITMKMKAKEE